MVRSSGVSARRDVRADLVTVDRGAMPAVCPRPRTSSNVRGAVDPSSPPPFVQVDDRSRVARRRRDQLPQRLVRDLPGPHVTRSHRVAHGVRERIDEHGARFTRSSWFASSHRRRHLGYR